MSDIKFGSFKVTEFHLFLSKPGPGGSVYSRVASFALGQDGMMGALAVIAAYLIGAIPFGLIVVKLMTGADVRASGSGNIGATNVLRTTGRLAGVLTLVLDAAKGYLAVWLANKLTGGSTLWMSFAALAVLLGHAFPVWLKFEGGKAVATFVGAFADVLDLPERQVEVSFSAGEVAAVDDGGEFIG